MLDEKLLSILVCPQDRGGLLHISDERLSGAPGTTEFLYNPRLRRAYRVDDGIPVLLIDEAFAVDDAEHQRLIRASGATGEASRASGATGEASRASEATGEGTAQADSR